MQGSCELPEGVREKERDGTWEAVGVGLWEKLWVCRGVQLGVWERVNVGLAL